MKKYPGCLQTLPRLNIAAAKLRGIGFLIENLADEEHPLDLEEIHWGIGMLLSEISKEIRSVAKEIDVDETSRARNQSKKST